MHMLERLANRMPGDHLTRGYIDDPKCGKIMFATTVDADRMPHGIWACRGTGRILDFKPDTDMKLVRQTLVTDAANHVESLLEKGVLRDG